MVKQARRKQTGGVIPVFDCLLFLTYLMSIISLVRAELSRRRPDYTSCKKNKT